MKNKYTVKEKETSFIEVEKSKFYGIIFSTRSKDEFLKELEVIKKDYPKARHYCYAYILESEKKSSDNGEPTNTAGKPILNILEVHNLVNVGLVVVRYFGGTLLGAGRLTRSYALAAEEAYKNAIILKLVEKTKVRVLVDLDTYDKFLSYLKTMHYINIKTLFTSITACITCIACNPKYGPVTENPEFLNTEFSHPGMFQSKLIVMEIVLVVHLQILMELVELVEILEFKNVYQIKALKLKK